MPTVVMVLTTAQLPVDRDGRKEGFAPYTVRSSMVNVQILDERMRFDDVLQKQNEISSILKGRMCERAISELHDCIDALETLLNQSSRIDRGGMLLQIGFCNTSFHVAQMQHAPGDEGNESRC